MKAKTMDGKNAYELKGTLRDDCMTDRTTLEGFRPLEDDWKELMRWLMSVDSGLSSPWKNHVLTVLVEILQKDVSGYVDSFVDVSGTSVQQKYFMMLKDKLADWISRLEAFIRNFQSTATNSPSVTVARLMIEQMSAALSNDEVPYPKYVSTLMDTMNQPYYNMLGAVKDIQKNGLEYVSRIESGGDIDASLSLLLTFVRNYCSMAKRFNARFGRWAEFYSKNILHDTLKRAVQDSTYIVIEPDRTLKAETFQLPKGTKFIAGQNADGTDLLYATTEKSYIVPAHIKYVHSLFCKEGILYKNTQPAETGDASLPLFDTDNPSATALEYGWVLVSRSLVLSEGKRVVVVGICLSKTDKTFIPELTFLDGNRYAFILQLSGSNGWLQIDEYGISTDKEYGVIRFTFTLDEGEEGPVACSEELHGFSSEYPALRILFADRRVNDALPADLRIIAITINTEVECIRNFTLIGEAGQADPSQAFYPFGPLGEHGSKLVFGNEEAAMKNITSVTLKGTWTKLPDDGFKSIYENYGLGKSIDESCFKVGCEWQEGSRWHECASSSRQLFRQDGAGKLVDEAVFELELKEKVSAGALKQMPYKRGGNGLYRLTLTGPEIGFGTNAYYRRFTEVMMHNCRAKERNRLPVPVQPLVPMLSDVTFGYRSAEVLSVKDDGNLYRFSGLIGYEKSTLNENDHPLFLPCVKSPSLLVKLDNIGDTNRIRFYLDLRYAVKGWTPVDSQTSCNLVIDRYCGNGVWSTIADEDILCEETEGLTRSGFIEMKIPAMKDTDRLWLKLSFADGIAPKDMILDGMWLNCIRLTAENGDGTALPVGTITLQLQEDSRIVSVCQPMEGIGGKPAETEKNAAIRRRIRISTRNRAVCNGNYEEMILEHFPEIEKVCCIPASENGGNVRIVVFPKPERRKYPFLPGWKLSEIENYIKRYASAFAMISVLNPVYEPVSIVFKAVLKDDIPDSGMVKRRLTRRIRVFLMTWYMDGRLPDFGVRYSCNALLSRIVNDSNIKEFISLDVEMERERHKITEVLQEKDIFLSASDECGVLYIKNIDVQLVNGCCGVDEGRIGVDFMIR